MPFYEYEYIAQNLIDILKEKQEAEEGNHKSQQNDMNPNSIMKQANKYLPAGYNANNPMGSMKMPSSPAMNFPSIPSSLKI